MIRKRTWVLCAILALVFALPTTVSAQGTDEGEEVVFSGSYRLEAGERLSSDLVVFGGSAEVAAQSVVEGNLMQFGGSVDLAGEVFGSLVVLGGSINLQDTAIIHGDFARIGGTVEQSPDAIVMGNELDVETFDRTFTFPFIFGSDLFSQDEGDPDGFDFIGPLGPLDRFAPRFSFNRFMDQEDFAPRSGTLGPSGVVQNLIQSIVRAFFYAVLAVLVVLFLGRHTERVRNAVVIQPFLAGGLGILSVVIGIPLIVLLGLTIILLPVSLVALVVLLALGTFGWFAVGLEVGSRVSQIFKRDWHPALAAGVGVLTLFLAKEALYQIPCIGFLATLLVASVGLGAVWLTRFGTRDYQIISGPPTETR